MIQAPARSISEEEHIRFVYHDVKQPEQHTFCRLSSSSGLVISTESKNIPQLHNKEVIYSSNNGQLLLLLHKNIEPLKFNIWKLITDESIELPDGPHGVKFEKGQALISSSPDDPNFLIVYLFREDSPSLLYCRVGDDKDWTEYNYATSIEAQKPRCVNPPYRHTCGQLHQPVSVDGRVYAFYTCARTLVQVTVDASNNCTTNMLLKKKKKKKVEPVGCFRNYLVQWGDDIYRIVIFLDHTRAFNFCEIPDIKVLKFNFERNSWKKVKMGLKGWRIFLGNRYSLTSSSSSSIWSFIYFTSEDNQVLHSYKVEDETITSYSPYAPKLPEPWLPHWIMPAQAEPELKHEPQLEPEPKQKDKLERKFMENEVVIGLHDLMPELIGLIAENLSSFVDYIYFLSTNIRVWDDVRITRKNEFRPCLIYRDKVNKRYHITDGSMNRKLSVKIPKDLRYIKICCSRNGWLMVYKPSFCALFNPFTSQLVRAEDPNTKRKAPTGLANFTFTGKPSSCSPQNCSILAMALINISSNSIPYVKSGRSSGDPAGRAEWWRFVLKRVDFNPSCTSPVMLGEYWYHLGCNGRLGRLLITDLKQGKFKWEEIQELSPCSRFTRNYLTDCGGELVAVFIGGDESWVRVFKIDMGAEKKWQEIDSLSGYCLYVGRPSCMSCVAETVELADRIYFPKFYKDELVYYSLKSNKYHSIGNEQDEITRFHPTTMFTDCAWINPNLSN